LINLQIGVLHHQGAYLNYLHDDVNIAMANIMNSFDEKLKEYNFYPLIAEDIATLQVNIGYKCNLSCTHCHVEASPYRTEEMSVTTIDRVLRVLRTYNEITTVDITGGSPELNPYDRAETENFNQ